MTLTWDLSLTIDHLTKEAYRNWDRVGMETKGERGPPNLVDAYVMNKAQEWVEISQGTKGDSDAGPPPQIPIGDSPPSPPPEKYEWDPWQH